jgi:hypothetical protein
MLREQLMFKIVSGELAPARIYAKLITNVILRERFGVTGAKPYRIVAHRSRQSSTFDTEIYVPQE